ncbi:MAG TPA: universal stress protein [Hanamia sp.]
MKNILVPIDFSTTSHNAGKYAASMAEIFNAKVTFFNVVPDTLIIDEEADEERIAMHQEKISGNKNLMAKEIKRLTKNKKVLLESYVYEGSPCNVILNMAKENNPDIIIMGMKGKGQSNSVFGSTVTSVVRKSSIPVLIIPEMADYLPIDTITLATDFDTDTYAACYALLMKIAKKYNSFIQVLNVQKKEKQMNDSEFIGKMDTQYSLAGLKHSFNIVEDTSVIEGINKFIEEKPCDMLAMMAHKHSFTERLFGKVYTKEMSYATVVPLLVLQNK